MMQEEERVGRARHDIQHGAADTAVASRVRVLLEAVVGFFIGGGILALGDAVERRALENVGAGFTGEAVIAVVCVLRDVQLELGEGPVRDAGPVCASAAEARVWIEYY